MKNKRDQIIYEVSFSAMAIVAVFISAIDLIGRIDLANDVLFYNIELLIIIIFAVDYFARLILAKDKRLFLKTNIPDLIAIIPFSTVFKLFRLTNLLKFTSLISFNKFSGITRIAALIAKFNKSIVRMIRENVLLYIMIFSVIILFLGAVGMYIAENNVTIHSFGDALWWCFLMVTTVGATDITPVTFLGRSIAVVLMLVGIGTISILTATVASVFIFKQTKEHIHNDNQFLDLSDLNTDDFKKVEEYIEFIRSRK